MTINAPIENVSTVLNRKRYASGAISPAVNTLPGATGATSLRHTSFGLNYKVQTIDGRNEVREDRQISGLQTTNCSTSGAVQGLLSCGTYTDELEAAFRTTKIASISKTQADFTSLAASASGSSLTLGGGTSWSALGFKVGDLIRVTGTDSAHNRDYVLTGGTSTLTATVYPAPSADLSADTSCTITRPGVVLTLPTAAASFVDYLFGHEMYNQSSDTSELYTESRITGFAINMPTGDQDNYADINMDFMGRDKAVFSAANAPYFTAVSAGTTTQPLGLTAGFVLVNGAIIGNVTGAKLDHKMNGSTLHASGAARSAGGQLLPSAILLGSSEVSGSLNAIFDGSGLDALFLANNKVELMFMVQDSTSVNADGFVFYIKSALLTSGDKTYSGKAGVPVTYNFLAEIPAAATGYDTTTLKIQDTAAT